MPSPKIWRPVTLQIRVIFRYEKTGIDWHTCLNKFPKEFAFHGLAFTFAKQDFNFCLCFRKHMIQNLLHTAWWWHVTQSIVNRPAMVYIRS